MHRNVKKYVIARVVTFTIVLGVLYMGAIGVGLMAFNLPLIGYTKGSGFFWAIHEFVLAGIYGMLLILRCVPSCAKRLPTKVSFWIYDGLLFLFHNAAAAGYLVRAIENGATSYWYGFHEFHYLQVGSVILVRYLLISFGLVRSQRCVDRECPLFGLI